jgi:hypothetical protein
MRCEVSAMSWTPDLMNRLLGEESEQIGERFNIRTVATDGDVTTADDCILRNCAANKVTLSLPSAQSAGKILVFVKVDASANVLELDSWANDLCEGSKMVTLSNQWDKVTIVSDGLASWVKIAWSY